MTIWGGICGFILGLAALGIITSIGTAIGIPSGLHWLVVGVPFLLFMTYGGAISK